MWFWLIYSLNVCEGILPRIVAVSPRVCMSHINKWISETSDPTKRHELQTYRTLYDKKDVDEEHLGSVAVVVGHQVCALTMLENVPNESKVVMWYLYSDDMGSGTLLLRALIDQLPELELSNDVAPRWYIARSYFTELK